MLGCSTISPIMDYQVYHIRTIDTDNLCHHILKNLKDAQVIFRSRISFID